jgi:hypothetical protein
VDQKFSLIVTRDEYLEHRTASKIEELNRAGSALEERPVDKIDRGATVGADMAAKWAVAVNIEIVFSHLPWRQRGFCLEHAVLGMDDEHDWPPRGHFSPNRFEARAWCDKRGARRQAIEYRAQRRSVAARDFIENAVGLRLQG